MASTIIITNSYNLDTFLLKNDSSIWFSSECKLNEDCKDLVNEAHHVMFLNDIKVFSKLQGLTLQEIFDIPFLIYSK